MRTQSRRANYSPTERLPDPARRVLELAGLCAPIKLATGPVQGAVMVLLSGCAETVILPFTDCVLLIVRPASVPTS